MNLRDKNPSLKAMIISLEKTSRSQKTPLWNAVARGLNRPRQARHLVSLRNLDATAGEKETIIVPGTIVSDGTLTKPLTVAAWKVSAPAQQKIEQAGGTVMTIPDLLTHNPTGKGIRLMG